MKGRCKSVFHGFQCCHKKTFTKLPLHRSVHRDQDYYPLFLTLLFIDKSSVFTLSAAVVESRSRSNVHVLQGRYISLTPSPWTTVIARV